MIATNQVTHTNNHVVSQFTNSLKHSNYHVPLKSSTYWSCDWWRRFLWRTNWTFINL